MAGATRAVFLSYRREETRHVAGRLADQLTDRLGLEQIFMDVDTIEPGADFAAVIAREVGSCKILIALIGPTWATTTDRQGRRRLDDPDDFVVLETRAALERGIPIIPVLVDGAMMPDRGDLPEALQGLRRRHTVRLDHDTYRSDVTVLFNAIDRILSALAPPGHQPTRATTAPTPRSPVPQRLVRTIKASPKWIFKEVNAVVFSPDGRLLASGSRDGMVRLWDPATGQPVGQLFTVGSDVVLAVAFSPDGRLLASSSRDEMVRLWDPATGQPVCQPLNGHTKRVNAVAFSPDGRLLASGSGDGTVRLWDPATGQPAGHPLTDHTDWVNAVAFSPDGRLLASGSRDGTVRLWDPATGQPAGHPLTDHTGSVNAVAFSPDGRLLASGNGSGTVRLWDPATGQPAGHPLTSHPLTSHLRPGHTDWVNAAAFSPDGRLLASGNGSGMVRLWDPATGQPVGQPLNGHTGSVTAVAFSPDGRLLASGSSDGTVRLWGQ